MANPPKGRYEAPRNRAASRPAKPSARADRPPRKLKPAEEEGTPVSEAAEAPAPREERAPRARKKAETEPVVEAPAAAPEEPQELPKFADLGLNEPVLRAVTELGFETPTPIQARAIPAMLEGRDLLGMAQTGTGKTAAFGLPLIQNCDPEERGVVQALVLAPTRELAVQVAGGIHDYAKHTGLRTVAVYGGQPIDRQIRALRQGAEIIVGTPGRVQDHMRRGTLSLENIKVCVLDEADEMLALGFLEDMETILSELPEERQLAFFSATMPPRIASLTKRFLHDGAETIAIEPKRRTLETTNQTYYEVPKGKKLEALGRVLDMETPGQTVVFCRTRQETQDLAEALRVRGYDAEPLHGDMGQPERDRVMRRFREGGADILVATDVAARGLDIDTVTHVVNYDIPWDVEQYIHRIGRTGRAGRSGDAITLVEPKERRALANIERLIGRKINAARIPTIADIAARRREVFREQIMEAIEAREWDGQLAVVEELCDQFDPTEIAAAALQMLWTSRHSNQSDDGEELAADFVQPEQGMTRIFVGMGRQDGLRPGDLVGAIANEAGLESRAIGAIDILDRTAFVEVPSAQADRVVDALRNTKLRNKKVKVQLARPAEADAMLSRPRFNRR